MPESKHLFTAEPSHTKASAADSNLAVHGSTSLNIADLRKGIRANVFLLKESSCPPIGEENKAFTAWVTPILEQTDILHILARHWLPIFFTALVGKVKKVA